MYENPNYIFIRIYEYVLCLERFQEEDEEKIKEKHQQLFSK